MALEILDAMRHSISGKNTALRPEELKLLNLEVIVLEPGAPQKIKESLSSAPPGIWYVVKNEGYFWIENGPSGFPHIDTRYVADFRLDGKTEDEIFDEERRTLFEKFRESGWKGSSAELDMATARYELLRPTQLLKFLQKADLVVAPLDVHPALVEAGVAHLAELAHGEPKSDGLAVDISQREVRRLDETTASLLYSPDGSVNVSVGEDGAALLGQPDDWLHSAYSAYIPLDRRFAAPLASRLKLGMPSRSLIKFDARKHYPNKGGHRRFDFVPRESGYGPANNFGLGGRHNGYRHGRNEHLKSLARDQVKDALKAYADLWLTIPSTMEELRTRQATLEELIAEKDFRNAADKMQSALRRVYFPFVHLSAMSEHMTANTLGSRWGARMSRPQFYADFLSIGKQFVEQVGLVKEARSCFNPEARDLRMSLAGLDFILSPQSPFGQAYQFIRTVVEHKPRDFDDLRDEFRLALIARDAKLIPELEAYKPEEDQTLFKHFKSKDGNGISLRSYTSDALDRLRSEFQRQNPVTGGSGMLPYLVSTANILAAYVAVAQYISEQGWVKVEFAPAGEGVVEIKGGYYPFTEARHTPSIVRNDTNLDSGRRVEILHGPNVSGKTIDLRKAMLVIAASMTFGYAPAEYVRLSPVDQLLFRLKGSGTGHGGALVEELRDITSALEGVSEGASLAVMGFDEAFTSTNPVEGAALMQALLEYVAARPNVRGIFTTHFKSVDAVQGTAGVGFAHFPYDIQDGRLIVPHTKQEGPNPFKSYGIPIAEAAGLDKRVIERARARERERL